MGADNWEACPRCLDRAVKAYAELLASHGAKYGVVTIEEWATLSSNLPSPPDDEDRDLQTFREDYEWWIDKGELHGSWRGSCTKCGLTFKHEVGPLRFYTTGEEES